MSHYGSSFPASNSQQQQQDQYGSLLSGTGAGRPYNGGGSLDAPRLSSTAALDSHIADMFAQRRSTTNTLDDLLSRRNNSAPGSSLDDTTAVLDACILDLTRRRLGLAVSSGTGSSNNTGGGASVNQGPYDIPPPQAQPGSSGSSNVGLGGGASGVAGAASTLAVRQQQLQNQQFELEQRQKELERQRQQLLAGIQETSMQASGLKASMEQAPARQQWWVCQVCNSKAFSSREEAMQHENFCMETKSVSLPVPVGRSPSAVAGGTGAGGGVYGSLPSMSVAGGNNGNVDVSPTGPFTMLPHPMPLAMESDKDWLTPLHCFVRRHCVQVFCATAQDVATPSKGKRKPIKVGQVGIRCPHCHAATGGTKERGSVYYPTTIASIYNATMNLLQRHLHSCTSVPREIMTRYQTLKADDARSGTSKKYWVESALSLGLVDTPSGIRFSALAPPPLPRLSRQQHSTGVYSANRRNSNDFFSTKSNADFGKRGGSNLDNDTADHQLAHGSKIPQSARDLSQTAPLVTDEDRPYATAFSFHLLSQMRSCVFTEADRLGKRKGLPPGFAGLACRHCFGGYGSGRFFPSSIKTLSDTSKTLNVLHNHMMRCRKCPGEVKETLEKLRAHHDEERAKMKFGSQKAFFAKIWRRLHENDGAPSHQQLGGSSSGMSTPKRSHGSAFSMPPHASMLHKTPTSQAGPVGLDWGAYNNDPNKRQRLNM